LQEFARYFAAGSGQLWERQALCKARPVCGSPRAMRAAAAAVHRAAFGPRWRRRDAAEIQHMRRRLEDTALAGDLKRGPGGIVDIEFLTQMLQLRHARKHPRLRTPNTLAALAELRAAELLAAEDCRFFETTYRWLRTVEGRLQLMNSTARDTLPRDATELNKLAHLLQYPSSDALLADYETATQKIRRLFDQLFEAAQTRRA
jgi:glutamate-ammonia-ligase adenylyltransferase